MGRHLAEVNIGRVLGGRDDPRMAEFFDNLASINALAERMPGFVWRLKDETGDSAMALHWPGDPTINVNMSVWESADALGRFVFQTVHRNFYVRKHDFFEMPDRPMFALWWVAPGTVPTLDEAKARLDHYAVHGPSDYAFGWPELREAGAWVSRRCA